MIALDVRLPLSRFPLRVAAELSGPGVAVLGPSGAGKTSLLETIAGLRRGATGVVRMDGDTLMDTGEGIRLAPERRRIGYVPQDACLFPHLDVRANVRFGMRGREPDGHYGEILDILEIGPLISRYPATLSGGERQRVSLARAIATRPRLLLLDEPLAAVDLQLKERILPYLLRVRDALRIPFLYVTHNAGEAAAVADEAVLLREGQVVMQDRAPAVLRAMLVSAADPEARFENVIAGVLEPAGGDSETATLHAGASTFVVPAGPSVPPRVRLLYAVSPDDILVSTAPPGPVSARNVLRGAVLSQQASEAGTWLRVAAADREWTVRLTRGAADELGLLEGAGVWLTIKAHAFHRLR